MCPLCPLCLFNFHVRFLLWLNVDREKLITLQNGGEKGLSALLCSLWVCVGCRWFRQTELDSPSLLDSASSFRAAARWCAGASKWTVATLRQRANEFRTWSRSSLSQIFVCMRYFVACWQPFLCFSHEVVLEFPAAHRVPLKEITALMWILHQKYYSKSPSGHRGWSVGLPVV